MALHAANHLYTDSSVTLVCPVCGHESKPVPEIVLRKVTLVCNHRVNRIEGPPALMTRRIDGSPQTP
jgi:hypothetical protein